MINLEKEKTVIVEGIKDKRVLEDIGFNKIITLNGRPLYKIVEELNCKEIILLVDLDKEGKKLYSKLKSLCSRNGIKVDDRFRNYLFKETKIRQIEGLKRLF